MSLLGFGDVVLPGLLVSFTLSFDVEMGTWKNKLYFLTSITAYLCDLFEINALRCLVGFVRIIMSK